MGAKQNYNSRWVHTACTSISQRMHQYCCVWTKAVVTTTICQIENTGGVT